MVVVLHAKYGEIINNWFFSHSYAHYKEATIEQVFPSNTILLYAGCEIPCTPMSDK